VAVNFICGLGHGDPSGVFPRLPRLAFEEACTLG
jgi:3-hydroxypropanoate dehydrogenase